MKIKCIHHVSIVVNDTNTALDFYCGVIGLPLNPDRPALSFPGAWLDIGDRQIHLIENDSSSHRINNNPVSHDHHIAFQIDSVNDLKDLLSRADIPYTMSKRRPALFCRDPDGNGLEFIEVK